MPADFQGLSVISFESRRAEEMASLIQRHGGMAISAPSMREIANPSHDEALAFLDLLMAEKIDAVVLLTGVGTRFLAEAVTTKVSKAQFIEAMRKVPLICRGPKPVAALREMGLKPTLEVPEPNTWQDLLKALDAHLPVTNKTVAVQEYGMPNQRLLAGLEERGATVVRVPVYKWGLPEDLGPLRGAIEAVIAGEADVVMCTSATQWYHMLQVAERGEPGRVGPVSVEALREGFKRVLIASIGPVASEAIIEHGMQPDYEPDSPHMANLVRETARRSGDLLEKKRIAASNDVNTNRWKRVEMVWGEMKHATRLAVAPQGHTPAISIRDPQSAIRDSSPTIADSVFMKACRREPVPYTPIWLMRQAGRYQRAYREVRAQVTMLELCRNSELCAEVTLMAVDRLGVDAAIIFSDILTVCEPLGFSLDFVKGDGPVIHNPFRERKDIERIRKADASDLEYVYEALRITRRALRPDIALIGFCGAPFTIASYLIEGGKSKDYAATKTMMYRDPVSWNTLMERLVDLLIGYLRNQIAAGADCLQIFDSWVGSLNPDDYREHVMPHVKRLIDGVREGQGPGAKGQGNQSAIRNPQSALPLIHFGTNTTALLPLLKETGADVIGLDWRVDLAEAWNTLGHDVAVMGNLDPIVLHCSPAKIREQAKRILDKAAGRPGHIFNLGHGITPDMPPEHVAELVDAVHELSARP